MHQKSCRLRTHTNATLSAQQLTTLTMAPKAKNTITLHLNKTTLLVYITLLATLGGYATLRSSRSRGKAAASNTEAKTSTSYLTPQNLVTTIAIIAALVASTIAWQKGKCLTTLQKHPWYNKMKKDCDNPDKSIALIPKDKKVPPPPHSIE